MSCRLLKEGKYSEVIARISRRTSLKANITSNACWPVPSVIRVPVTGISVEGLRADDIKPSATATPVVGIHAVEVDADGVDILTGAGAE